MKSKSDFRKAIRLEKQKYSVEELTMRSERIMAALESLPEFHRASTLAAYWSLPDEVSTRAFIEKWCGEKTILLPVMCAGNELELRQYSPGGTMNEAAFCIREPEGAPFPPARVDLILVPGVAFDRHNRRLGRGKGYYDRTLARMDAYKVGICFDFQLFDEIPADPYDINMDAVIAG